MKEELFTKINIKVQITETKTNQVTKLETTAIKQKNKLSYIDKNEKCQIIYSSKNKLILKRTNEDIECIMYFEENKILPCSYQIKSSDINLEIDIKTDRLIITENKINIKYTIVDSNITYEYNLEMSEGI